MKKIIFKIERKKAGSDCPKTQNKITEFESSNVFSFNQNSSSQDLLLEDFARATCIIALGDRANNIFALVQQLSDNFKSGLLAIPKSLDEEIEATFSSK